MCLRQVSELDICENIFFLYFSKLNMCTCNLWMTTSQITHSCLRFFSLSFFSLSVLDKSNYWRNKLLIKNKQNTRIYGICACALTHSKFDHSRHRRIILLFIIRILNSKYLNDDDDEGESERE